jgi:hypothetical protein
VRCELEAEVVGDGVWTAVVAGVSKLTAQSNDGGLDLGRDGMRAGTRSS